MALSHRVTAILKPNARALIGGITIPVAVSNITVVVAYQTTDINRAVYRARGVAAANCTNILAHQTTDINRAVYRARGVAVGNITTNVRAHQTADIPTAAYRDRGLTGFNT